MAVSSNIGSAATIIGNPQNMLIGQVGQLDFGRFFIWCMPPALISLSGSYLLLLRIYRDRMHRTACRPFTADTSEWPAFTPWQSGKGIAAIVGLVMLFTTLVPR